MDLILMKKSFELETITRDTTCEPSNYPEFF